MADTAFRSDDNLTKEVWSAALFRDALKKMWFGKFVGETASNIIQVKNELTKSKGDKITFGLRMQLKGQGTGDDGTIEGNEENLTLYDWSTTVHERGNGVRLKGKMTAQRTVFNLMAEAKDALSEWLANMFDNDTFLALSGLANPAIRDDDGTIVAAVSPSNNRKWYGGQTAAGVVTTGTSDATIGQDDATDYLDFLFGTKVIDIIKRKAQAAIPKIRPVKVDGEDHYVMLIHPLQAKALRGETAWLAAQQAANIRGRKNPIFSGALGIWNGVVIHESESIQTRTGAAGNGPETYFESGDSANATYTVSIARALFLGAQAGVHAYAQRPSWYAKMFDYGRKPGVATDLIYVAGKPRFNGEDYGVITVDTCVDPD